MNIKCVFALGLAATAVLAGSVSAQEAAKAAEDTAQVATADPLPTETDPGPAPTATPFPEPQDPLGIALKQVLTAPPADVDTPAQADRDEQTQADLKAITKFYEGRTFEPVWVTKDGMSPKADAAIGEIKKADDWGLEASAFTLPGSVTTTTPEALAQAELTLSKAVLKYARHARGGRIMDPASDLSSYLDRKPQLLDPVEVMGKFASNEAADAVLRGLHPQHPQFEKLRQAYLKLRDEAAKKQIVKIPDGPLLREGMTHEHVALVRKRLKIGPAEAIGDKPADDNLYDEKVKAAVVAYQEEKGLSPDGLVGRGTRASLNDVQVLSTDKLLANMEQWRWMPADMGDLYVWANIPEFTVRIVKNGNNVIHTERIITGLVGKQTPVFSENLKKVIFRPRWNVPNSIKVRELYPSLLRGGRNFERQGLRLTHNGRRIDPDDVDWDETDIRRFDVHQPPGPGNVLGVVKFAFPNKHLVYMHDTPTKHLFNKTTRAYSHGCMRVRNPVRMAEILLEEDKGWSAEKVDELVEHGPGDNQIDVTRTIPVHATYFTAWVDDAGETQIASDVYGHEKRIKLALAGKWDQIAKGADHLAPVKASRYLDDDGGYFYSNNRRRRSNSVGDYVQSILGGGF
jgi:L,D-transpeptidase YcbB